jgi:glycosyltransferase involved in cell wall biosynthesis
VLTLDAPENVEVTGDAGIHYKDSQDLTAQLQRVLRDGAIVNQYRQRAQARVRERYEWEHVVDQYEDLFARMAGRTPPHARAEAPTLPQPAPCAEETVRR